MKIHPLTKIPHGNLPFYLLKVEYQYVYPFLQQEISKTFSVIGFIAYSTLKLVNHTGGKNVGGGGGAGRFFKAKIMAEFILTFENNM